MPISHFIYRCPYCGHDPVRSARGRARCEGCARTFTAGEGKGKIRVRDPRGNEFEVDASRLAGALEALGEGEGMIGTMRSRVTFHPSLGEDPIYRGGGLLGFVERCGPAVKGLLLADGERVRFRGERGETWDSRFLDLRAIQASSSSVQLSPLRGEVATFRFDSESPRRWEDLLKRHVRDAWRRAGCGEVVEFQPRIRTR